jgi:hypothetical protein
MKSAYNTGWLHNLNLVKEAKQWQTSKLASAEQVAAIQAAYPIGFYHPNMMIRILLFVAALIAIGGVTGLFFLIMADLTDEVISVMAIAYGIASIVILEKMFIQHANHYKSGVTEALLYQAMGFIIGGLAGLTDFNEHVVTVSFVIVCLLAAIRYHDLVSTAAALIALAYLLFFELYNMGGVMQQIIPMAMIGVFTPIYFYLRRLKVKKKTALWRDCLLVAESLSLLIVYAAGNYFVVRELSEKLLNQYVAPGEDIPFAFLFYSLTIMIPIVYLYVGIVRKDGVLLRISLLVLAFSVFTFKFYYSTGHHEITFTLSGAVLLLIAMVLFRYLKTIRNGFTRENSISDKWANVNAEAFIISQTMGGNQVTAPPRQTGGGGTFGGGGASGEF